MDVNTVRVELGERSYEIYIGRSARKVLQTRDLVSGQVALVADQTVADLHLDKLRPLLPAGTLVLTFPPGEGSKSLEQAREFYERLGEARLERNGVIVTFGGGVAADLGGFVAGTWLRGVRLVHVPTTTLACVDASVGGKTAVNLPAGKNLVGVFHQPMIVIVDTDFLDTLPDRDFVAGLAESAKQGLVRSRPFFEWQESEVAALRSRDADAVGELIARGCAIKAEIVSLDERESGLRAILNYGHSIGHALECLLEYELRHGECVALGMLAENELACARGVLSRTDANRVRDLLTDLGLPLRVPRPVDPAEVVRLCRLDKKTVGGALHFVLLRGIGEPVRAADVTEGEIAAALKAVG
jgi:3-dehydroquinate synthase